MLGYAWHVYEAKLKAEKTEAQREAMETLKANQNLIELMKEEREKNCRKNDELTAEISRLSSMCRRLKEFINSPVNKDGV